MDLHKALLEDGLRVGESYVPEQGGSHKIKHLHYKESPYFTLSEENYKELIQLAEVGLAYMLLKRMRSQTDKIEANVKCSRCDTTIKRDDAHFVSIVQNSRLRCETLCDECYKKEMTA